MELVINAVPLAGFGSAFYTFLGTALTHMVADTRISRIRLFLPAWKKVSVATDQSWMSSPKVDLVRRRIPAPFMEPISKVSPFFTIRSFFPKADLFWNPHHIFFQPMDRKVPIVVSVHGLQPLVYPEFVSEDTVSLYRKRMAQTLPKATLVHAVSEAVAEDLRRIAHCDPAKIRVVHNGVDQRFSPLKSNMIKLKNKYGIHKPFALVVGTVSPWKNQIALVRVWEEIRNRTGIDVSLILVGGVYQHTDIFQDVILEEADRRSIQVLGLVPHLDQGDDLLLLYSHAAAVILPSYYEGCNLSVIEALACGAPIACADIPSLKACLGDSAVFFNPSNRQAIVDTICSLLTNPPSQAERDKASIKVLVRHSASDFAKGLINIFIEAIATGRKHNE